MPVWRGMAGALGCPSVRAFGVPNAATPIAWETLQHGDDASAPAEQAIICIVASSGAAASTAEKTWQPQQES